MVGDFGMANAVMNATSVATAIMSMSTEVNLFIFPSSLCSDPGRGWCSEVAAACVTGVTLFRSPGRHNGKNYRNDRSRRVAGDGDSGAAECGLAPDRIVRTIVIDLYLMIARLASARRAVRANRPRSSLASASHHDRWDA